MAVVGLGMMNIFLALNLRFPEDSAFGRATLSNPKLLWAFAWAVVGSMLITQMRVLQDLFHTTPLTGEQWAALPGAGRRPAGPRRAAQDRPARAQEGQDAHGRNGAGHLIAGPGPAVRLVSRE